MYAEHAKAGSSGANLSNLVPSLDDVRLAVQARTEGATVPKEVRQSDSPTTP
jgi:transcription initiation factor TFIID subunit 9B